MSLKHSLANKKRWAKVSKEKRSKKGSEMATAKWKKATTEEKKKHSLVMLKARDGL